MYLKTEIRRGKQIDCYTEARRIELCTKYKIKLYFHSQVLSGVKREGAANKEIGGEYYIFSISDSSDNLEYFTVGAGAAKHFMQLTGEKLNETNSFNVLSQKRMGGATSNTKAFEEKDKKWHPAMKELHNLVNLTIALFVNSEVNGAIKDIKEKTERHKLHAPFASNIKSMNTILKKYLNGLTLQEHLINVSTSNKLRKFNFKLISKTYYDNYGEKACFE